MLFFRLFIGGEYEQPCLLSSIAGQFSRREVLYSCNKAPTLMNKDKKQQNASSFGQFLAKELESKRLTITEVSRRSGLSKQTISSIARQTPHHLTNKLILPEIGTVDKIARALGVPIATARAAAGYAADVSGNTDLIDKIIALIRELPQRRQEEAMQLIETLHRFEQTPEDDDRDDVIAVSRVTAQN